MGSVEGSAGRDDYENGSMRKQTEGVSRRATVTRYHDGGFEM